MSETYDGARLDGNDGGVSVDDVRANGGGPLERYVENPFVTGTESGGLPSPELR